MINSYFLPNSYMDASPYSSTNKYISLENSGASTHSDQRVQIIIKTFPGTFCIFKMGSTQAYFIFIDIVFVKNVGSGLYKLWGLVTVATEYFCADEYIM